MLLTGSWNLWVEFGVRHVYSVNQALEACLLEISRSFLCLEPVFTGWSVEKIFLLKTHGLWAGPGFLVWAPVPLSGWSCAQVGVSHGASRCFWPRFLCFCYWYKQLGNEQPQWGLWSLKTKLFGLNRKWDSVINHLMIPSDWKFVFKTCVICVSIPVLQIGSSVPFFQIPYMSVNMQHLFFSFWLTSLCITGSRSSTLLELTQMSSFYWLSNIPLCICTTSSLSIHLHNIVKQLSSS